MPSVAKAEAFAEALAAKGVLISDFGAGRLRVVTHYGISEADCRQAVSVMQSVWPARLGSGLRRGVFTPWGQVHYSRRAGSV